MTLSRPLQHAIFPSFLQNHSVKRPGLDLENPDVFDRFLRFNALFSRALVISDSDLNNNAVFHHAAQRPDGLFWPAMRTGFIRRAVREDASGDRLTQTGIAEGLRHSNPGRYSLIPEGYPVTLDKALAQPEQDLPPLIWRLPDISHAFGSRLLALLAAAEADRSRDSAQRALIGKISDWVRGQRRTGTGFGAADIEQQLMPLGDGSEHVAWRAVWPTVLQAYTGNIPAIFHGNLAVTGLPEANDRMLPAGPESGPEESAIKAQLYAGGSDAKDRVELEVRHIRREFPLFDVSIERLDALGLEQIEELRETAQPDDYFDARFSSAGSGEKMMAGLDGLREANVIFLERLASAGVLLTEEAQRSALRSERWASAEVNMAETQVVALQREALVEYTMMHSFPLPGAGPQVLGCDFTSLVNLIDPQQARDFFGAGAVFFWAYKRPDFRVVQRMGSESA
jgi:hypothetical protein